LRKEDPQRLKMEKDIQEMRKALVEVEKSNFELERKVKVKEWDIESFRTEIQ
jgi:hypothetical protein